MKWWREKIGLIHAFPTFKKGCKWGIHHPWKQNHISHSVKKRKNLKTYQKIAGLYPLAIHIILHGGYAHTETHTKKILKIVEVIIPIDIPWGIPMFNAYIPMFGVFSRVTLTAICGPMGAARYTARVLVLVCGLRGLRWQDEATFLEPSYYTNLRLT